MTQSALPRIGAHGPALLRHVARLVGRITFAGKETTDPPVDADSERLELLRHCTHEGLWDWDLRSDRVHYFPRFRELLGYAAEEPLSRAQLAFHPDDAERMRRAIRRLLEERIPIDEEFRLRRKNGDYRWFRGRGRAVWDEQGRPLRFAGSIADISEYKENELRLLQLADHDALTKLPNRRLFLERLSRAIERSELEIHYQPQVAFADGEINSVEALLRWNNPELGWVPPAQFIPLAEETGLIHPIGAWVLETACAQARAWQDAGLRPVRMCINVSARQLNQGLVETVSRVLAQTGLSSSWLELEITESVMVSKDPDTEAVLQALRALGIGFAIDDFGTGYASFDYLKRLPVRTLKLDGSFVRGVCENVDDVAIVAASVSLARSLGLSVVAEGVETAEQHARLKSLGCDDCQGYYVHRPLTASGLKKLLEPPHVFSFVPEPRSGASTKEPPCL
jgi:PAS domain S-box-containing protein